MSQHSYNAGTVLRDYLKPYLRPLGSWKRRQLLELCKGLLQSRNSILSDAARQMLRRKRGKNVWYRSRIDEWVKTMSDLLFHLPWNTFIPLHWKRLRRRQQDWTMVIHDPSDIAKPWAKKMEGLSDVHDGSEGRIVTGYDFTASIGIGKDVWDIHPIDCRLINPHAKDFTCKSDVLKDQITNMCDAGVGTECLHVLDRGFDDEKWFVFLEEKKLEWMIRLTNKRHVHFRGEKHPVPLVAETLIAEGKKQPDGTIYGFSPIGVEHPSLKGKKKSVPLKQYSLIAVQRPQYKTVLMLLVSGRVQHVQEAIALYCNYLDRWEVEDYLRFLKQCLSVEVMQLMKHAKLASFVRLQMLLSDFVLREYEKGKTPIGGGMWEALQTGYVCTEETLILSPYVVSKAAAELLRDEAAYGYSGKTLPLSNPSPQLSLFPCTDLDTL